MRGAVVLLALLVGGFCVALPPMAQACSRTALPAPALTLIDGNAFRLGPEGEAVSFDIKAGDAERAPRAVRLVVPAWIQLQDPAEANVQFNASGVAHVSWSVRPTKDGRWLGHVVSASDPSASACCLFLETRQGATARIKEERPGQPSPAETPGPWHGEGLRITAKDGGHVVSFSAPDVTDGILFGANVRPLDGIASCGGNPPVRFELDGARLRGSLTLLPEGHAVELQLYAGYTFEGADGLARMATAEWGTCHRIELDEDGGHEQGSCERPRGPVVEPQGKPIAAPALGFGTILLAWLAHRRRP